MGSRESAATVAADGADWTAEAALLAAPVGMVVIDGWGRVRLSNARFRAVASPSGSGAAPRTLADFELSIDLPGSPGACPLPEGRRLLWSAIPDGGWIGAILEEPTRPAAPEAGVDPLTGVGDRLSLPGQYEALMAQDGAYALYVDLDRFKRVNDTLGHETGDLLLRNAAQRMREVLRKVDFVGRVGGDEFVALLAGPLAPPEVERIAERLIDKLSRPFLINGSQVLIGASIGLAKGEGLAYAEVLRRADVALYESKRQGRGRGTWYAPEMMSALEERRQLEHALRRALLLEEFVLHFQPQYSLGARAVTGFEALLRWQRPTGLVPPSEFIAVAEETGLMVKIGSYVLNAACQEASRWSAPYTVAVNVSPLQFMDEDFVAWVAACLERWKLPPARLELELTETLLLNEDSIVEARMKALRDMGVGLSLDDFGTGYASLSYLRRFPFDKIKIDQSFVRDPLADASARKIAGAMASLGADLGISVIAEGVETAEQLERLRKQGVGAVQGYYLSEPIPADAVAGFVASWTAGDNFKEQSEHDRTHD
ncbi:MAG: bifunctional diguanylate cyclase/phosphodiesterase [Pseudomonadota bacterium]